MKKKGLVIDKSFHEYTLFFRTTEGIEAWLGCANEECLRSHFSGEILRSSLMRGPQECS